MKLKNDFLQALLNEISLQKNFLKGEVVETIYFGGGTPSLLSGEAINSIVDSINKNFSVVTDAEITLEANPDDISVDSLNSWHKNHVNRLSIGVQSFFEADLKWMNRAHSAAQAEQGIKTALEAGFTNITIDLIYGTPTLTDSNWHYNVEKAIELHIPHLSCYSLTVEPKTPLDTMINKKTVKGINPEVQARQFLLLMDWLNAAGYEHYEISNFSIPGKRSKHNSSYWLGKNYLGLGPSAHSFNGTSRQWNIANNALYIQSLKKNIIPFEAETLTTVQKLNEWIMISLRTREGLRFNPANKFRNDTLSEILQKKSRKYIKENLLVVNDGAMILTTQGKLYADGIAAALFFDETEIKDDACVAGS